MMTMRTLAPWLPSSASLLTQAIVKRALCDIGICEMPPGSNRSTRIDEYNTATGAPIGSYWCASALSAWWREAGAAVPTHDPASCAAWLAWGTATTRLSSVPREGYAVLYGGADGHADHCGVVVRVSPLLLSVEGNTSLAGFNRNGVAVELKYVDTTRVLGYVSPTPLT